MKNLLKKNQLMITALAIMIAVAGYLQFAGTNLDDEDYLPASGQADILSGVTAENLTSEDVGSNYNLDGLLDLSEEDLATSGNADVESLETDVDTVAGNYLDTDMEQVGAETGTDTQTAGEGQAETPADGEIPGEAVFTSGAGLSTLSDAKLMKEQTRARNKETLMEIINSAGLTDAQKQNAVDTMVRMTEIAEKETAAEILLEAKGFSDVIVSINDGNVDVVVNALELDDIQRAQIEDIVKRKTEVDAANIVISTVVQ